MILIFANNGVDNNTLVNLTLTIFDFVGSVEYSGFGRRDRPDFRTEKGRKRFCDGKGPTDINQKVQIMEAATRLKKWKIEVRK